jgi:TolA-binding protein
MSDERQLAEAFRALRENVSASSSGALTRARILVRAQERGRRKRRLLLVLPFAAAFAAATAWAGFSGQLTGEPSSPSKVGRVPTADAPAERPPAIPAAPPTAAPVTTDSTAVPSREPHGSTPTPTVGSASASAASTREQALYEIAHRSHFVEQSPASALRAWDAYLAQYPNGRFALEARYNRAISLVRLGRRAEARAALTPFAQAPAGSYRRAEARELLDALRDTPANAAAP